MIDSVGVKVSRNGSVLCQGRTYWSEASYDVAGQWVSLKLPRPGDNFVILTTQRDQNIRADLLDEGGFLSPAAAKAGATEIARSRRPKGPLVTTMDISDLAELIDQRLKAHRDANATCTHGCLYLRLRDLYRRAAAALKTRFGGHDA